MGDHQHNGCSFVDRDGWLARRATPRLKRSRGVMLYESPPGSKPLILGINRLKRQIDVAGQSRQQLIKSRHAYYRSQTP